MPDRRVSRLEYGFERLEERGLLSGLLAPGSDHLDLLDGLGTAADIDAPVAGRSGSHLPSDSSGTESLSHPSHEGGSRTTPAAAKGDPGRGGTNRRLGLQTVSTREIPARLFLEARRPDSSSSADLIEPGSDVPALGTEAASEQSLESPLAGWGAGAGGTMAGASTPPSGAGFGAGSAGPYASGVESFAARSMPPGAFGDIMAEFETRAQGVRVGGMPSAEGRGELAQVGPTADRGESPPAWEQLLEASLRPDWDGIDREVRQLLGRIGTLANAPKAREAGRAWLAWIGVAVFLYLSHRTSMGRQRFFRRTAPQVRRGSPPIGPWPLSPP